MDESRSSRTVADTLVDLARKWRLIVPFAIVTPLVVFALTSSQPATYSSSAEVLLSRQGFVISDLLDPTFWYPNRAQMTQARLARLPDVAQRVVDAAGVADRGRYGFLAQSSVEVGNVTDIMTFRVRDSDPQLATRLATVYAEQYIAYRRDLDTRTLRRALAQIGRQLQTARGQGLGSKGYADLVQHELRLNIALATVETNAKLVRAAGEATRIAPKPESRTLRALLLALVTGAGIAGLLALLDPRARTAEDISAQLGLPLVGRLPLNLPEGTNELAKTLRDASPYADAAHLLRASLELDSPMQRGTVLITGADSRESAARTTAVLALALLGAGRRVTLIDFDLRRPALARLLGVPSTPGVAEVARGAASFDSASHVVQVDREVDEHGVEPVPRDGVLRVVPSSAEPGTTASAIISASGVSAALETIRDDGGVVLLYGPPILEGSDALTLSQYADALLVVADLNRYRRRSAREIPRLLALSRAAPLGLVVVGQPAESESPGYLRRPHRDQGLEVLGRA